jgi:hypothetical protein
MRRNFDRAVKNFYSLRARAARQNENEFLPTEPKPEPDELLTGVALSGDGTSHGVKCA